MTKHFSFENEKREKASRRKNLFSFVSQQLEEPFRHPLHDSPAEAVTVTDWIGLFVQLLKTSNLTIAEVSWKGLCRVDSSLPQNQCIPGAVSAVLKRPNPGLFEKPNFRSNFLPSMFFHNCQKCKKSLNFLKRSLRGRLSFQALERKTVTCS